MQYTLQQQKMFLQIKGISLLNVLVGEAMKTKFRRIHYSLHIL